MDQILYKNWLFFIILGDKNGYSNYDKPLVTLLLINNQQVIPTLDKIAPYNSFNALKFL